VKVLESQKAALYETVHRSTLPLKAIADRVGLAPSTLSHMADENSPDSFPFKRLPALIAAADNRALLDYYEHIAHRVAIPLPVVPDGSAAQVELLAAAEAIGETIRIDRDSRADLKLTLKERAACVAAARRVMEAAQRYIASLDDEVTP